MAVIPKKFEAGALADAQKSTDILRDIAADLAGLAGSSDGVSAAAIAAVAAAAPAAVATADSAVTAVADSAGDDAALVNDLKAKYNAAVTLINALKAQVNVLVTAVAELRTLQGTTRTLANELRSDSPAAYTVKTTAA